MVDVSVSLLASARADEARRCCPAEADLRAPGDKPGSRRRRLWELEAQVHCPVVGVCLPIAALRRLFAKHGDLVPSDDDYQLHCDAMDACKRRTPLAESLQREFERRYALAIQQSAHCKSTGQLAAWWDEARRSADLAGAVWATISHSRCDQALQHRMLGEVHMHQHQAGAAHRVDQARFDATLVELGDARGAVVDLQERLQRQAADHARERADDHLCLLHARAELLRRDATIAQLHDEKYLLAQLNRTPDRGVRADDAMRDARERIASLERALARARNEIRRLSAVPARPTAGADGHDDVARAAGPAGALDDRAVLCVGGRPASVPLYRRIVERTGGRFLHHDGGDEESVARLDATLAAADLVICQTGCISHDAYWRVKDHCKRTGKRCVFVENPGSASLKRALADIDPSR